MTRSPRRTALVVCPGRGTYNATELGYLGRHHADRADLIGGFDAIRAQRHEPLLRDLDSAAAFKPSVHGRGDNASALIFASSFADFLAIDRTAFDIVAVTGNSMGWYTALSCAGALSAEDGFSLCDAMGGYMTEASIGGQAIWTLVDEDWRPIEGRRAALEDAITAIHGHDGAELYASIELGGMLVVAGDAAGLAAMTERAPKGPGRFPLALAGHAAFHTPMQTPVAERARATLPAATFHGPAAPLVDGSGRIWRPHATDPTALWNYTLGEQVVETYDFTGAMRVALHEFAPEAVIVLGPGEALGSAVAQSLIAIGWRGLAGKGDFARVQAEAPLVLSMGREGQRAMAVGG